MSRHWFPKAILLLIVVVSILCVLTIVTWGDTLASNNPGMDQYDYRLVRTVTTDDTPLTTATKTWTTVSADTKFVQIPQEWTWVSVSFYAYGDGVGAGDPTSGTCDYTILGVRRACSAQVVCTGALAVGGLTMSHQPYGAQTALTGASSYAWIEGEPTCTDYWPTGVTTAGTSDDIGSINFSTMGIMGFTVEITNMSNVTSVTVVYTGGR